MKVEEHLLKSLFVMAEVVEARDPYTGGHLWRVSQLSLILAQDAGLAPAAAARVALGGFLHDLGKIGIPDAILNKPGFLTDDEYEIVKTHPHIGLRLLGDHLLADLVRDAILLHHERPDGRGYPQGMGGELIPLDARMVGIADGFDAMTSARPYRQGMPIARALEIIEEHLGSQFDGALGRRFVALGRAGRLDHVVGHSEPGIPLQLCPMCGPTIVVRRDHRQGDSIYCRHCGGEVTVDRSGGRLTVHPTGRRGAAADLEPQPDYALIDELVAQAAARLAGAFA